MKLIFFFILLYCIDCQANDLQNISNPKLADNLQKMVVSKGKIVQTLLYKTVAYCSNNFPDTEELYLSAKKNWNKNNLPVISGSRPIPISLLLDNGIEQEEIPILTKFLLSNKQTFTQEKITTGILKLSSKTKEKQRRDCNLTTKAFSDGKFNLQFLVISDYKSVKEAYQTFPVDFHKHQGITGK